MSSTVSISSPAREAAIRRHPAGRHRLGEPMDRQRVHTNRHGIRVLGPTPVPLGDLATAWARAWWPIVVAVVLAALLLLTAAGAR